MTCQFRAGPGGPRSFAGRRPYRCDPGRARALRQARRAADARHEDPFLMIAMDTPQVTPELLGDAYDLLRSFDAVIGPTTDGGWYAFGLREPSRGADLETLTDSNALTLAALRLGLRVALLPTLPAG
ncbi:hypothetical protein Asp14428_03420 [Actinoplanes sp. NBRC 14428]|uniref:Glycosyltransferase n=1 Tax=Pseudosporangium ferrugineum TaxID=439699 RepID=A0A2T0SIC1_9ACTN|nr:DUF2064 domain-containing protein [Pseudosporangium ferrugineum]PRY33149.1 hypothetical protein CLV70_101311 [Pseudosporangium ferrugineum]BCJ48867.1 hypothetical protein Asp14428_03420 [Actinoplanes sp. NBRC 14428]